MWVWLFIYGVLAQEPPAAVGRPTPTPLAPEVQKELSDRLVTSVVETRVDSQMLQVDAIRTCVRQNAITDQDIAAGADATRAKRAGAALCMKQALDGKSEDEIIELADQLDLQNYNLVSGRNRQSIVNYFTERIQNALYGEGAAGEDRRIRDRRLVDHGAFNSMYESQLGRNIQYELSGHCYGSMKSANNDDSIRETIVALNKSECGINKSRKELLTGCINHVVVDTKTSPTPTSSSGTPRTPAPSIYQNLADELGANSTTNKLAITPDQLKTMFITCIRLIPHFCELKTYCDADPNERAKPGYKDFEDAKVAVSCPTPPSTTPPVSPPAPGSPPTPPPARTVGAASCVMQAKLRAFQTNMRALEKTKEAYTDMSSGGGQGAITGAGSKLRVLDSDAEATAINDITTMTSKDTAEMISRNEVDQASLEECSTRPEDKACEDFFFTKAERDRFEQAGLIYSAATEAESARIEALAKNKDDLKKYLEEKGYVDLLAKVGSITEVELVALARQRFESEREAAYGELEKRFLDRQQEGASKTDPNRLADQFRAEQNNVNQLMLFNNVITSFLEVKRGDEYTTNEAVRRREVEAMRDNPEAQTALQYFEGLSSTGTAGSSSSNGGETVTVDLDFINNLLRGDFNNTPGKTPGSGTR
jgi:hypothetical protein